MKAALFLALILAAGNCGAQTISSQVYPLYLPDQMVIGQVPSLDVVVFPSAINEPFNIPVPDLSVEITSPVLRTTQDETYNVAQAPSQLAVEIHSIVIYTTQDQSYNVATAPSDMSATVTTIVVRTTQFETYNVATSAEVVSVIITTVP